MLKAVQQLSSRCTAPAIPVGTPAIPASEQRWQHPCPPGFTGQTPIALSQAGAVPGDGNVTVNKTQVTYSLTFIFMCTFLHW